MGNNGIILKTMNGGTTWTALSSGTSNPLESVYFTDSNTGYTVGDMGTILKITNGGGAVAIKEPKLLQSTHNIYPNPATDKITITLNRNSPAETIISIFNISGQQLISEQFSGQNLIQMDVSSLAKGIYFVKIQTNAGIESKKLVIQ